MKVVALVLSLFLLTASSTPAVDRNAEKESQHVKVFKKLELTGSLGTNGGEGGFQSISKESVQLQVPTLSPTVPPQWTCEPAFF